MFITENGRIVSMKRSLSIYTIYNIMVQEICSSYKNIKLEKENNDLMSLFRNDMFINVTVIYLRKIFVLLHIK